MIYFSIIFATIIPTIIFYIGIKIYNKIEKTNKLASSKLPALEGVKQNYIDVVPEENIYEISNPEEIVTPKVYNVHKYIVDIYLKEPVKSLDRPTTTINRIFIGHVSTIREDVCKYDAYFMFKNMLDEATKMNMLEVSAIMWVPLHNVISVSITAIEDYFVNGKNEPVVSDKTSYRDQPIVPEKESYRDQ